jgi:hypothetical protein
MPTAPAVPCRGTFGPAENEHLGLFVPVETALDSADSVLGLLLDEDLLGVDALAENMTAAPSAASCAAPSAVSRRCFALLWLVRLRMV